MHWSLVGLRIIATSWVECVLFVLHSIVSVFLSSVLSFFLPFPFILNLILSLRVWMESCRWSTVPLMLYLPLVDLMYPCRYLNLVHLSSHLMVGFLFCFHSSFLANVTKLLAGYSEEYHIPCVTTLDSSHCNVNLVKKNVHSWASRKRSHPNILLLIYTGLLTAYIPADVLRVSANLAKNKLR